MTILPSSYRDADGFVFEAEGKVFRFIRPSYFDDYRCLMDSGLYAELTAAGRLISHEEIKDYPGLPSGEGIVLLPEQIPFISYPYEWSFDMWRDAALVTLKTVTASLQKEMILKDATPFNIQFYKGRPVFIDTLSFEKYEAGKPWVAYRQFCECFLGPLLLMHYGHRDMGKLFMAYPAGIPLEIIKELLPRRSKFNLQVYLHIWLQAKMFSSAKIKKDTVGFFPKEKLELLLKGLTGLVSGLRPKKTGSEWEHYYSETISGGAYLETKKQIFNELVSTISFRSVIDLGANDGLFSLLLKEKADWLVAVDADSNCINELYGVIRKEKIKNMVPLVSSLDAPSPGIGWANAERPALTGRLKADLVLALALVHHLAIAANIPLEMIAAGLKDMGGYLIIEFVPKTDEKVIQLLKDREDIFEQYHEEGFRSAFGKFFRVLKEEPIAGTGRKLFLMQRN